MVCRCIADRSDFQRRQFRCRSKCTASEFRRRCDREGQLFEPGPVDEPRFQVILDTHSVNLDAYDLKSMTILRDDAGKYYAATRVENKGSGHHREATVSFAKLDPDAKRVELVLKDVAGVPERVFRWNIE